MRTSRKISRGLSGSTSFYEAIEPTDLVVFSTRAEQDFVVRELRPFKHGGGEGAISPMTGQISRKKSGFSHNRQASNATHGSETNLLRVAHSPSSSMKRRERVQDQKQLILERLRGKIKESK